MRGQTRSFRSLFAGAFLLVGVSALFAASVDLNNDGTVSIADYAIFRSCLQGVDVPVGDAQCADAHFDADSDIDLADFSKFQLRYHPGMVGNFCDSPIDASDGTVAFSTMGATTDGPVEPLCNFFGNSQVSNDIWFCYTATCSGEAAVSLCGSDYDTKLAVYDGCGCPTAGALACNDDGCGSDITDLQSRISLTMEAGHQYGIRVGGFVASSGDGILTIRCGNTDTCAPSAGDCFTGNAGGQPGCNDVNCCHETCGVDQFCCDVNWDDYCAGEATGLCTGNFASCTASAGDCHATQITPGCNDSGCCNTVCGFDPFCCLTVWDDDCVIEANGSCFFTCTPDAGDCLSGHPGPGCNDSTCCQKVCGPPNNDTFCCDTQWDSQCAGEAFGLCGQ